jgi:glutamate racemase
MKFGVFDSGIGGVTVLQALRRRFPGHSFVYFGDTLHVPYGTKSAPQIRALSISAAERIRAHDVEALVVACTTASSLALPDIQTAMGGVPVLGMVEAGVAAVVKAAASRPGPIVVFGTRATIRSGIYGERLRAALPGREIREQACPLLVPIIEEGWLDHPVLALTLKEYAGPHLEMAREPGVALLACTHYPWIRTAFKRALPGWTVVDSADATVHALEERFAGNPAFAPSASGIAPVEWFFSDPEVARFIFAGEPEGESTKVGVF